MFISVPPVPVASPYRPGAKQLGSVRNGSRAPCKGNAQHRREAGYCAADDSDAACVASNLGTSFGVHPGGAYGSVLRGTWVAPAEGVWLLRIDANCDVPYCASACSRAIFIRTQTS